MAGLCNVCKYPQDVCAEEFSLDFLNVLPISGEFKTRMVIPCMLGDHFTRRCRGEMKLESEITHEWYEFDVRKEGEKYYIEGEWEMFASIYNIKQGDELCFVMGTFIHENLHLGHLRRFSGGIALPRCTIAEYEAEQELMREMEECTSSVDTH
uniref:Uncharacterized protein n=1 Tax=Avena sativa TaxID=4498 RepID=A0ACD5XNF5_AVESA